MIYHYTQYIYFIIENWKNKLENWKTIIINFYKNTVVIFLLEIYLFSFYISILSIYLFSWNKFNLGYFNFFRNIVHFLILAHTHI